ncbi:MAG: NAD(P)/FAD-dependent oxidoreductase [Candidatus Hodarchaeales archaeon]|jgi:electron transfer flavoprotein-quinone oxidoreductase
MRRQDSLNSFDVIIIGGGPTGLSTAITITKNSNLKTLILEEHSEIGNPLACGEGISTEKLLTLENMPRISQKEDPSTLKFQEEEPFIEREIISQRFFFGSKGVATSNLNTVTINRPLFDKLLAREAEEHGAIIQLKSQVTGITRKSQQCEVRTQKDRFSAPLVIGCDGPSAHSVQMMNLAPPSEYVQGVEYKIEGVHTDALDFYFNFRKFPKMHYGWVFPKKTHTNVGIVTDPASKPKKMLNKFVDSLDNSNMKESPILKEIAGIIPASGPISKKYCNNYMVAGDAAGMTNTIFYGGIAIGIHTGMLAGETAIKAHDSQRFDDKFLSQYQNRVDSFPYSDPAIQKAHEILYSKFSPSDIETFGSLLNGWDITTISGFQKFILFLKALKNPSNLKRINEVRTVAYGFSKSRDWGF